ncbi:MAG: hypothetical protein OHK0011_25310 [Turneriella sp.]
MLLFKRPEFMSVNLLLQSYEIDFLVCHRCIAPVIIECFAIPNKDRKTGVTAIFLLSTEH